MILFALIILMGISFTVGLYLGSNSEKKNLARQFKYLDDRREQLAQRSEALAVRERAVIIGERAMLGAGRDYILEGKASDR